MQRTIVPNDSVVTFDYSAPSIDPIAERKPIRRIHIDRHILERDSRHKVHAFLRQVGLR